MPSQTLTEEDKVQLAELYTQLSDEIDQLANDALALSERVRSYKEKIETKRTLEHILEIEED